MPATPPPARPARGDRRRRPILFGSTAAAVMLTAAALTLIGVHAARAPGPAPAVGGPRSPVAAARLPATPTPTERPGALMPGSDPDVLPADVLIADRNNNRLILVDPQGRVRWQFPRPGDLLPGETFRVPDDAFFAAGGTRIVATQEDDFVISVIDVATHRIVYRYGTPGVPGAGPNRLDNPDDALMLPDRSLLAADIKNCRIIAIPPGGHAPRIVYGQTTQSCLHRPPARFGSPNGAFPMRDGDYLITEINGDWVDELTPTGRILWSTHPPGVAYPSDSNEIAADRYLTVDYSTPGQVVEFDRAGHVIWRYRPMGAAQLRNPSLARPLPNGDVLLNDDRNHRVIVVDPRTNRVVWQYGHTGLPGVAPGYLDNPDGVDLAPPYSMADTRAGRGGAR